MKKIILSVLLLASFTGFAQLPVNKLTLQKGQKIEVTTNVNISSTSMLGEMNGNVISTDVYTVSDVTGGNALINKAPKNMKLNFSMMGKEYSVDSDNKEDMEGQLGEPVKELMKTQSEFTIDASGKIIAVKSDPKKRGDEEGKGGMLGMMMPGMNMAGAAPKVGGASIFKILPDAALSKGLSWVDSTNEAGNRNKVNYTVKDLTATEVLLDFTGEGNTKATQAAMGMSVDVNSASKSSGTVTIDKSTGLFKQRTVITTAESSMNMSGQEMNSTVKTTAVMSTKIL